jgi:cation diffusion facilitator family transporter
MQNEKERVALTSIAASGGLTAAKGAVGLSTGSLAILSEAAHSLLDLIATVITYFAVRISGKPADEEHHYGHGKIESVSALAATALLFLLAGVVAWEASHRLAGGKPHAVAATPIAFAVIIGSIVIDFFRARVLYRVADRTSSHALEADALHFSSDMWSSLAVLAGLGGIALGYPWADAAAALVVAVFICIAGWRLGRRTVDALTDTAPVGIAPRVTRIAEDIGGVVSVDRVRARPVGGDLFVEITVGVSRTLPLDRVAAIKQEVSQAIVADIPSAEVTVTVEPRTLDNETVLDRIMVIARNRALAIHHVTVHTMSDRLLVAADLELDGHLTLKAAHDVADAFEAAVRDEFGSDVEIETHIEPLQAGDGFGRDADPQRVQQVVQILSEVIRKLGTLRDVHDVRVRHTDDGEIVNFHCRVDPTLSVQAVHELVDEVEYALRQRLPEIKRVLGHAEPLPTH